MIEKKCKNCGKLFKTDDKRKKFCNRECYLTWQKDANTKLERGFTDCFLESISNRCRENAKFQRNKSLIELYGEEKAISINNKKREKSQGDNNPMSLLSISKRNNCSLEEARKLTPCFNRIKEKHPMFKKNHTIDTKIKMSKNAKCNGGMFPYGYFDNIRWQSTWELNFLINSIEKGECVRKYDLQPIEYIGEDNKIHHYFPDYIIGEKIFEIKGNEKWANTKIKKEAGEKLFKENFIYINKMNLGCKGNLFLKIMKEKYGERLIIEKNPYPKKRKEKNGN